MHQDMGVGAFFFVFTFDGARPANTLAYLSKLSMVENKDRDGCGRGLCTNICSFRYVYALVIRSPL